MRCRSETYDGRGSQNYNSAVVERSSSFRQSPGPSHHQKVGEQHHREDCPEPVGTVGTDVLLKLGNRCGQGVGDGCVVWWLTISALLGFACRASLAIVTIYLRVINRSK